MPRSDSLTDLSTENFFEIAIVKFGLRGVGTEDAANGFPVFTLARYCNLQRVSTPMEAKQGVLREAHIMLPWRHVEFLQAMAYFLATGKHRGSQFADILKQTYSRPKHTLRPYHTNTYRAARVEGQESSHKGDRTVCQDAATSSTH